jgi:hypothetical protein
VHRVRRGANGAAHTLVREALTLSVEQVLIEETPPCVVNIVSDERCTQSHYSLIKKDC